MYVADPKLLPRLEPHRRKVLVIDPTPAAARLLGEQLRAMGAREVLFEPDERRAFDLAATVDPTLIFVERSGPRLDGEAFARRLRRSEIACRKIPLIMVTGDATATTIKGARDSGVHEFLRKPFTSGDLLRRVEVVALKPRDWIEAVHYVGPDRRRFNSGEYAGPEKRQSEKTETAAETNARGLDQAVRILRSALLQFESDPHQAKRAMLEQAQFLKRTAATARSAALAFAAGELEIALSGPAVDRAALTAPAERLFALFESNAPIKVPAA